MSETQQWGARINRAWDKVVETQRELKILKNRRRGNSREAITVELPLVRRLAELGHDIQRQVICAGGRIDILDRTASEIIECKARGDFDAIADAAKQLKRYARHFPSCGLVIAVPSFDGGVQWFIDALEHAGFRFIEFDLGIEG